jgi:hypothetical protein
MESKSSSLKKTMFLQVMIYSLSNDYFILHTISFKTIHRRCKASNEVRNRPKRLEIFFSIS